MNKRYKWSKKSFIFRDISGTTYHAELFRYGVVQETQVYIEEVFVYYINLEKIKKFI